MKGWKEPSKYGKENALGGPLCSTAGEDSRRERGLGCGGVLRPGEKGEGRLGRRLGGLQGGRRAGHGELGAPLPPSRRRGCGVGPRRVPASLPPSPPSSLLLLLLGPKPAPSRPSPPPLAAPTPAYRRGGRRPGWR